MKVKAVCFYVFFGGGTKCIFLNNKKKKTISFIVFSASLDLTCSGHFFLPFCSTPFGGICLFSYSVKMEILPVLRGGEGSSLYCVNHLKERIFFLRPAPVFPGPLVKTTGCALEISRQLLGRDIFTCRDINITNQVDFQRSWADIYNCHTHTGSENLF